MAKVCTGYKSQGHTPCPKGVQVFVVLPNGTFHCVACKKPQDIGSAKLDHLKVHLCSISHNFKMTFIAALSSVPQIAAALVNQQVFTVKPSNVVNDTFEATTALAFQSGLSMTAASLMSTAVARFAGSVGLTGTSALASMAKSKNPAVNQQEAAILSKLLKGVEEQTVLTSAEKLNFKQLVRKLQQAPSSKERSGINQGLNVLYCVNEMAAKVQKNQNPPEMRGLASRKKTAAYVQCCLFCNLCAHLDQGVPANMLIGVS